jgi:hypothetical protein
LQVVTSKSLCEKLCEVKCREALEKDVSPAAKVKAFLSATTCKTAAPNIIKPTIIEDYYNTFNAVDSLDTNVGNIPWLVTRYSTRVLIGLVQMTLVSSFSYYVDACITLHRDYVAPDITRFVKWVADELEQQKTPCTRSLRGFPDPFVHQTGSQLPNCM